MVNPTRTSQSEKASHGDTEAIFTIGMVDELGKMIGSLKPLEVEQQRDWRNTQNILNHDNVKKLMDAAGMRVTFKNPEMMEVQDGKRWLTTNSIPALLNIVEQKKLDTKDEIQSRALAYLNNFLIKIWKIQNGQLEKLQEDVQRKSQEVLKAA